MINNDFNNKMDGLGASMVQSALDNAAKTIEEMKTADPKKYLIFKEYKDKMMSGSLTAEHGREVMKIITELQK